MADRKAAKRRDGIGAPVVALTGADAEAEVPRVEARPINIDDLGLAGVPVEDQGGAPAAGDVSEDLKAIIEALIFASPDPLSVKALARVLDGEARDSIARVLASLKKDYDARGGLQLIEIAGGFQIVTRPDLNEWVRRLFHERKSTRLSVAALETLAVIAYRQPVTAAEIAEIRGVNTSGVLATLVERKLIKIAGRKAVVGRPFLYATTREFLLRFGLNDVGDLPKVEEMADALGFDLPAALSEPMPSDQFLPLDDPEESAAEPSSDHDAGAGSDVPPGPAAEAEMPDDDPGQPGDGPETLDDGLGQPGGDPAQPGDDRKTPVDDPEM